MAPLTSNNGYNPSTNIYQSPLTITTTTPTSSSSSLPSYLLPSTLPPSLLSKPAFIDSSTGSSLSFSSLRSLTASAASSLHSSGLLPGRLALLVSPNSLHFPIIALAVLSTGAALSTANPLLTRPELSSQVLDSRPFLIITTSSLAPKLLNLVPQPLIIIENLIHSLLSPITTFNPQFKPPPLSPNSPATVLYSSGTTGKSKGVVSTHGNFIAMAEGLRGAWGDEDGEQVYACVVPMTHMFGFSMFVCAAVAARATTVVVRRYSVEGMLRAVEEFGVTRLPVVPPMVIQMVRTVGAARELELSSLKEVICSGAPIGRDHLERFVRCYPSVTVSQCYGMTETSGPVIISYGVKSRYQVAMGRLTPSIEAKIVDVRTGKALPPNRHGELLLRGPPVMQGYLGNKEATSFAIDRDGWLRTGDLCYIDTRGLVHIVDRIKELIKYKAYQVAPAELEEILCAHPDIFDAAVLPYPHEEAGEIPTACIVTKAGCKIKEADIFAYMKDKVAPYKSIRKVIFLESIPRSPSGKILRAKLKEMIFGHQRIEIATRL